jgi:hypothetical protein
MKHLALITTIILSLNFHADAKWNGFFLRSSASVCNISPKHDGTYIPLSLGAGYGMVIPGMLYQGLYWSFELHPLSGVITTSDKQENQSFFNPHLDIHIGAPIRNCMPYTGVFLQYHSQNEGVMVGGLKIGLDFEFIHPRYCASIDLAWNIPLTRSADYKNYFKTGFSLGMNF